MAQLIPGVTGTISPPTTYTMHYLNGPFTYTERFAVLNVSPAYVATIGGGIEAVIGGIAAAVAAIPFVGPALAGIVEFGFHWYASSALNPDGSATFLFAYHFAGTRAGGIDLTASPLPGVPPAAWNALINTLQQGLSHGPRLNAPGAPGLADAETSAGISLGGSPQGHAR